MVRRAGIRLQAATPQPLDPDAPTPEQGGGLTGHCSSVQFNDLVTLPGSLILGLAVFDGRLSADEAHALARIDEDHQAEAWGRDDEAEAAASARLDAMRVSVRLLGLLRQD